MGTERKIETSLKIKQDERLTKGECVSQDEFEDSREVQTDSANEVGRAAAKEGRLSGRISWYESR